MTSSGPSGPPKESSKKASKGASELMRPSDPHRVEAAVDVDQLAGRGREPVREQGEDAPRDRLGVAVVPAEGRAAVPGVLERRETGDAPGGHGPDRSGRHQVHPDVPGAELP